MIRARKYIHLFVLAAVLIALVISLAVSARQINRLESTITSEVNYATWHVGQVEVDLYKFKERVHEFYLDESKVSRDEVVQSFDILWSRLDVVLESRETDAVRRVEGLKLAVREIRRTLIDLEPVVVNLRRDDPSAEEVIDQTLDPLVEPLHAAVVQVFHESEWNEVYRTARANDLRTQIELAFLGILLSGGALIFLLFREVRRGEHLLTAALEAKEAHRQSETRFRAFLENAPAPLFLKDLEGRLTLANRRFEEWYGTEGVPSIGRATEDFLPPDRAEDYRAHDRKVMETQDASQREITMTLPGGENRHVLVIKFPVFDPGQKLTGVGVFYADITDRKRIEQALLAAKEEAEYADRAKAEFLANMSHELRTPLHAVIGFADFIKDEKLGPMGVPEYLEYARYIRDAGQHLLDLITDILDLSKIEAGKAQLYDDEIDIERAVEACITLVMERAHAADVRLETDLPAGLPRLRADQRMVKQILINLLSNAVKFTPDGGRVAITAGINGAGGMDLVVTDTGIGMNPDDIPVALSRFGQVDNEHSRERKGTGLGLSLSRSIAEIHGGSLEVASELGAGTTVTVRFPADRVLPPDSCRPAAHEDDSNVA